MENIDMLVIGKDGQKNMSLSLEDLIKRGLEENLEMLKEPQYLSLKTFLFLTKQNERLLEMLEEVRNGLGGNE